MGYSPRGCKKSDMTERLLFLSFFLLSPGSPCGSDGEESACSAGDLASISGLGRPPGEGNGYRLQYSGLENSTDRGAWKATVHGVAKSQTQLSDFHTCTHRQGKQNSIQNFILF